MALTLRRLERSSPLLLLVVLAFGATHCGSRTPLEPAAPATGQVGGAIAETNHAPCHEGSGHGSGPCDGKHERDGSCSGIPIHWIDLETLAASLPPPPIDVVFDVDDTALFTSAGFQWGARVYGEDVVKAGSAVREEDLPNAEARRKFHEFWDKMNNELDQYSVRKWIAGELIRLHKGRGDRIHFVTKRIRTSTERLTEVLSKAFDLKGQEPVIFTSRGSKAPAFKQVHAQVSYGDSDGDIRETIEVGARPIRVMRARNSVNDDATHNGAFGEAVLIDSEN